MGCGGGGGEGAGTETETEGYFKQMVGCHLVDLEVSTCTWFGEACSFYYSPLLQHSFNHSYSWSTTLRPFAENDPTFLPLSEVQETFRHFTRDELEKIEQRIFDKKLQEKKKKERRQKNIQVSI